MSDSQPKEDIERPGDEVKLVDDKKQRLLPNWQKGFRRHTSDDKNRLAEILLKSDEDNDVKTRIPHVFAMTVMDIIGGWAEGKFDDLSDLLSPKHDSGGFGDRFRINAIAKEGLARTEFEFVAAALALGDIMEVQQLGTARLEEGVRKSK